MEEKINIINKEKFEIKEPKNYKVVMYNDDFTTMEFVVFILQDVFNKNEAEANKVMIDIHENGHGVAGVYSYDIAISKVEKVSRLSKEDGFPFKLLVEEE